jgi:hypothetical protein
MTTRCQYQQGCVLKSLAVEKLQPGLSLIQLDEYAPIDRENPSKDEVLT